MPKVVQTPLLTYIVTFNDSIGGYAVGEERMSTADYTGDDIDALAKEVIEDDRTFPMTFHLEDDNDYVVGVFKGVGDDTPSALMYLNDKVT